MSELLNSFVKVAPYINDLTLEDLGVTVADREEYLTFVKGVNVPQLVNAGDPIPESTVVYQAMKERKTIINRVDTSVFGFPYVAAGVPIIEGNVVTGAVSFVTSIEKQQKLLLTAEELSSSLEELTGTVASIDKDANRISNISNDLLTKSLETELRIEETDDVVKIIETIAKQTNLLGLNAAIEAARVGEMGKGFDVVAREIRKLANNSTDSIRKIEEILEGIKESSFKEDKVINEICATTKNQAVAIDGINHSIKDIYTAINLLVEDAKELLN